MVFQDDVDVEFLCEAEGSGYAHMEMGGLFTSRFSVPRLTGILVEENA